MVRIIFFSHISLTQNLREMMKNKNGSIIFILQLQLNEMKI